MSRFKHVLILTFVLATGALWGQIPQSILYSGRLADDGGRSLCNSFAGTIQSFGPLSGQSNDFSPDTIFLCLGDTLMVNHANDEVLVGDPVQATPGGVGYAFYNCRPTVSGSTAAAIGMDPCIVDTPPPTGDFYVYAGANRTGDLPFFNSGQIQSFFNMNNPVLMWFAPITFDAFNPGPPAQVVYEGNPAGTCVSANVSEAFAVVYLNAVEVTNIAVNGCGGTFTVTGGLPQWNNNAVYNIRMYLETDPAIEADIRTFQVGHGDQVEFFVPQAGVYRIEVEDGKSCGGGAFVNMTNCESVIFRFPFENVLPGQNVCVPVTVENAVGLISMQFTMTYDPAVLSYTTAQNFSPNLPNLNAGLNFGNVQPGVLTFSYDQLGLPFTLSNGEEMFELCFDVIGQIGDYSPLLFTGSPTTVEIVNILQGEIGAVFRNGQINVSAKPLFSFLEADSLTCPSYDDGSITATFGSGTPPYRVEWNTVPLSGPNNGPVIIAEEGGQLVLNNLPAGKYQFLITDSGSPAIESRDTVEVFAGPDLGATLVLTSPSCNGLSDGRVEAIVTLDGVVVTDPAANFTFQWNVSGVGNTSVLNNRSSGPYSVTITDNSGCLVTASGNMSQPPRLRLLANSTFVQNATCSGSQDGSISITATGGTTTTSGSYLFQWDNGLGNLNATSATVANLNPGSYCVTISDDNGCSIQECFTVGAVKVLSINAAITDVNCSGDTNGQIFISGVTTGAPAATPYTFSWSAFATPPVNTSVTSSLTLLPPGVYTVTMTDTGGCNIAQSYTVEEPQPLVATVLQQTNETCSTGNDGRVVMQVSGGNYPYQFSWSHDNNNTDSIAAGLSAGTYTFEVTDFKNCTTTRTVTVLAPTPPAILSLADDAVTCPENTDGVLTVVASPGAAPIVSYAWSNGGSGTTISNLSPGTYIVTVTDQSQCRAIDTAQVLSPAPLVLDSFALRLPDCPGFSNGQITVFASGGTTPYTYRWSTNPGTPTTINPLPALAAGSYSVTVQDANGCAPLVASVVLPDPPSITGSFSNITGVSCPDNTTCNGRATFTAAYSNGTTGLFNYSWSSGETFNQVASSTATQLCRGAQSVTVSDGVCGVVFQNLTIPSPQDITVNVTVDNVSCNGESDGTVTLAPAGGTAPYNFLWPATGANTATVGNLTAGTYNAVVTDANGCSRIQVVQITEPDALELTLDPVQTTQFVSCSGQADGVIAVVVNTGANINPLGSSPFSWSGNVAPSNSNIASGLDAGSYSVTVTDIEGCQDVLTYTISEPAPIIFTLNPIDPPQCFGDATFLSIDTVYGGAGSNLLDYTFMINNNGLNFPVNQPATVFAGIITVSVEDLNGCIAETQIDIPQPAQIVVELPEEVVVELGDSTVQLQPLISPGGNYTYEWTPATYLSANNIRNPFVYPGGNIEYSMLVTNENGCQAEASVFVSLDANRNVYIPNIFSPNEDGVNDDFRVFTCRGVKSINYARLYDRWGGVVYESADLVPSCLDGVKLWDGRRGGDRLPSGVYGYIIEITFLDDVTLLYRGDVTVVR